MSDTKLFKDIPASCSGRAVDISKYDDYGIPRVGSASKSRGKQSCTQGKVPVPLHSPRSNTGWLVMLTDSIANLQPYFRL